MSVLMQETSRSAYEGEGMVCKIVQDATNLNVAVARCDSEYLLSEILHVDKDYHPQWVSENYEYTSDFNPDDSEVLQHHAEEDWTRSYRHLETVEEKDDWIEEHYDAISEAKDEWVREVQNEQYDEYMGELVGAVNNCAMNYFRDIRADAFGDIRTYDYYNGDVEIPITNIRKALQELVLVLQGHLSEVDEVIDEYRKHDGYIKGLPPLPLEDVVTLKLCNIDTNLPMDPSQLKKCRLEVLERDFELFGNYHEVEPNIRSVQSCIERSI